MEGSIPIDPSKIMQVGMGFWASKTLLTAISMGLFTLLSRGELSGQQIREKLGLHERDTNGKLYGVFQQIRFFKL